MSDLAMALGKALAAEDARSSEVRVFDPDAIGEGMRNDLAGTLRLLADAIDAGEPEGFFHSAEGVGGRAGDERAHVRVVFRVAAEVVK